MGRDVVFITAYRVPSMVRKDTPYFSMEILRFHLLHFLLQTIDEAHFAEFVIENEIFRFEKSPFC